MAIAGIEQGRASYAFSCASEGKKLEKNKEYKSYVRKIPTLIRTNGLGATLAFVYSKAKKDPKEKEYAYKKIYEQIAQWLEQKDLVEDGQNKELVKKVVALNSTEYRLLTNEVLSLFKWLARFAEALIEGEVSE